MDTLKKQKIAIVVLIVLLAIAVVSGVTYAWYTALSEDRHTITLSNPVEVFITKEVTSQNLDLNTQNILPGDQIDVKLGVVMGSADKPSSDGYVRVKLAITTDAVDSLGNPVSNTDLIDFNGAVDLNIWKQVDFGGGDVWYVLIENDLAKIVKDTESYNFIDDVITIKTTLSNEFANSNIYLTFVVESIQSANIENPILDPLNPSWGKGV